LVFFFFFFNDTATTEIYTLSLHDALPICLAVLAGFGVVRFLKSSADNAEFSGSQQGGGVRYSGSGANRSHDTGYRDEFTK